MTIVAAVACALIVLPVIVFTFRVLVLEDRTKRTPQEKAHDALVQDPTVGSFLVGKKREQWCLLCVKRQRLYREPNIVGTIPLSVLVEMAEDDVVGVPECDRCGHPVLNPPFLSLGHQPRGWGVDVFLR